ncbi:MAG: HAD hydrolase-like protein [Lachnospiraceae bacterium]|nr:HAD hydrolase-like protein [Lachnospiraceae bacterium]
MFDYILFDLDGTVSDPKVGICTSVQYGLSKMGIDVPDINVLTPFIGPPLRDSFRDFYHIKDEDIEKVVAFYRERFSTVGLFENELYPGIEELLSTLRKNGKKLALASSKPRVFVVKILDYFGITGYFDVVMGSELDGTRENKVEIIEESLRLLFEGETPDLEKCVMVGDRKYDVEAAAKVGLKGIGVTYGYGSREELVNAGADIICDSVEELKNLLLS